jgi:glucose/arabinose dehydrogenase
MHSRSHVAALLALFLAAGESCAAPGQQSIPRTGPAAEGVPVETAPPNVPSFKPAFAGQTRARGIRTRTPVRVVEIAHGLNKPWALAFLPDRQILVTEKPTGRLFVIGPEGKKSPPVTGVPAVDGRDQCGLLDVQVGPDFASSRFVYLSFCEPRNGGNGLTVVRGRFTAGEAPKLDGVQVVFRMQPTLDSTKQPGGRLVFAPDGKLFVVLGDRYVVAGRTQAQDRGSDLGKIVRIDPDGSIPKDNPFVDQKGARPEIWTSGHRNILAAALDDRGRLWIVEMGPRGGDELNLIGKGKDYGWPTIGYGEDYSGEALHEKTQAPGMEQPVYYWDPVISPSGLTIYSGSLFHEWKGNLLIGGLSSKALVRLVVKGDRVTGEERLLTSMDARIREVVQGPEGAVYLLTDDSDGKLLKLVPDTVKER